MFQLQFLVLYLLLERTKSRGVFRYVITIRRREHSKMVTKQTFGKHYEMFDLHLHETLEDVKNNGAREIWANF